MSGKKVRRECSKRTSKMGQPDDFECVGGSLAEETETEWNTTRAMEALRSVSSASAATSGRRRPCVPSLCYHPPRLSHGDTTLEGAAADLLSFEAKMKN